MLKVLFVFQNKKWAETGPGEPQLHCRYYFHPISSCKGEELMMQIISFDKVKLTNSLSRVSNETVCTV